MRIFEIRDESLPEKGILAYLLYYDNSKSFYIELPDDADPWDTPLLLSSFLKRGEHTVGSYWSRMWVQQRIIPQDRQNLGQVLKENELTEYDELSLLLLSDGRCAQDDCYITEISADILPEALLLRWQTKVEDVIPLEGYQLLVFFRCGEVKKVDVASYMDDAAFIPFLQNESRFQQVEVQPDGNGIQWNEQAAIPYQDLYANGVLVPITLQDFTRFVQLRIVSASEACDILDCSRQNIDDLMKRGKLHPIRKDAKYKLFLRNEVVQRIKS